MCRSCTSGFSTGSQEASVPKLGHFGLKGGEGRNHLDPQVVGFRTGTAQAEGSGNQPNSLFPFILRVLAFMILCFKVGLLPVKSYNIKKGPESHTQ